MAYEIQINPWAQSPAFWKVVLSVLLPIAAVFAGVELTSDPQTEPVPVETVSTQPLVNASYDAALDRIEKLSERQTTLLETLVARETARPTLGDTVATAETLALSEAVAKLTESQQAVLERLEAIEHPLPPPPPERSLDQVHESASSQGLEPAPVPDGMEAKRTVRSLGPAQWQSPEGVIHQHNADGSCPLAHSHSKPMVQVDLPQVQVQVPRIELPQVRIGQPQPTYTYSQPYCPPGSM